MVLRFVKNSAISASVVFFCFSGLDCHVTRKQLLSYVNIFVCVMVASAIVRNVNNACTSISIIPLLIPIKWLTLTTAIFGGDGSTELEVQYHLAWIELSYMEI